MSHPRSQLAIPLVAVLGAALLVAAASQMMGAARDAVITAITLSVLAVIVAARARRTGLSFYASIFGPNSPLAWGLLLLAMGALLALERWGGGVVATVTAYAVLVSSWLVLDRIGERR